jgi:hypothetical protein
LAWALLRIEAFITGGNISGKIVIISIRSEHFFLELRETTFLNGILKPLHKLGIKPHIVQRHHPRTQDLAGIKKVPYVCSAKIAAGITTTFEVQRFSALCIRRIPYHHLASLGKGCAITPQPSRKATVK